jgi:hypothetical protein
LSQIASIKSIFEDGPDHRAFPGEKGYVTIGCAVYEVTRALLNKERSSQFCDYSGIQDLKGAE